MEDMFVVRKIFYVLIQHNNKFYRVLVLGEQSELLGFLRHILHGVDLSSLHIK